MLLGSAKGPDAVDSSQVLALLSAGSCTSGLSLSAGPRYQSTAAYLSSLVNAASSRKYRSICVHPVFLPQCDQDEPILLIPIFYLELGALSVSFNRLCGNGVCKKGIKGFWLIPDADPEFRAVKSKH